MKYRRLPVYKYQLLEVVVVHTRIKGHRATFDGSLIWLLPDGTMSFQKGYAWDGPSGPTIDTPSFMLSSLVHDALYQLIREGNLPRSMRKAADQELCRICFEQGMPRVRAWWVYWGVRAFGWLAVRPRARVSVTLDTEGAR